MLKDEINNLSQQLEIGEDLFLKKNEIQNEIYKLDKRKQDLELNLSTIRPLLTFFVLKQKINDLVTSNKKKNQ